MQEIPATGPAVFREMFFERAHVPRKELDMSNFSEGQSHQVMEALQAAGYTPEQVTKLGQYSRLGDFRLVLDGLAEIVRHAVVEKAKEVKVYLRRLFTFKLGATDSKDTYATARKVFKAGFDSDFENWGIVFSGVAPETEIAGDELILSGKFLEFLGGTAKELEKRRLLGSQFLKICRDKPDKLRDGGYANFFVLTKGDEMVAEDLSNVFVADVRVSERGRLGAIVSRFDDVSTWSAGCRRRILSPQQ